MHKKSFVILGGVFLYSCIIVTGWLVYSILRFDGIYSPVYVYGLSNPYKYYQKHIGKLLIEHGTEYKLEPTIDENNPKTYNTYRNKEHNFEFKYPKGFNINIDDDFFYNKRGINIKFYTNNSAKVVCAVDIIYKGRGVGKNWLPRRRGCIGWMITNHKELRYFYTKNGQIACTTNCGMPDLKLDKGALIDYTDKNSDKMYYITIGGRQCSKEIMINVITTFQFVE